MSWVAVGVGGGTAVAGIASSLFGKKKSTATQQPLETPEQTIARRRLLDFADTGKLGNYQAGAEYTGSLGDFSMSALEKQAQGIVGSRLTAGKTQGQAAADDVLLRLLQGDEFNPLNPGGAYAPLAGRIDRETKEASGALKRNAAFAGNLYSTDTIQQLGNVEARGVESKAVTLAGLYDDYINRKIGGVGQAYATAGAQEEIERGRTQDAFAAGSIDRNLNTARDQAAYLEFQRQRGEKQGQVQAAQSVLGAGANFGVPSVSVPQDNPWTNVLSLLAQFGGQYLGAKAGAKAA